MNLVNKSGFFNFIKDKEWKVVYEYLGLEAPWSFTLDRGYAPPDTEAQMKKFEKVRVQLKSEQGQFDEDVRKMLLEQVGPLEQRAVIVLTGSDARHEKRSNESPVELLMIMNSPLSQRTLSDEKELASFSQELSLTKKLEQFVQTSPKFYPAIRILTLESNLLSFQEPGGRKRKLIIPSRSLEMRSLYGDEELFNKFRRAAIEQLQKITQEDLSNFDENFYSATKSELERCLTKKKREPVNIETGALVYNPDKYLKIKYVLLRAVQYKLLRNLMIAAKDLPMDLLLAMPLNIAERIEWLGKQGILALSPSDTKKLAKAYAKSLQWYLQSQVTFEKEGVATTHVNPKELQNVVKTIHAFVGTKKIFHDLKKITVDFE